MENEIWKDIKGYEGIYQVSNLERIKSLERYIIYSNGDIRITRMKLLNPTIRKDGSKVVRLSKDKQSKIFYISKLVHEAFNIQFKDKITSNKTVRCITTNKEFKSMREASKYYNISEQNIYNGCNNKTHFGGRIILDDGTEYKLAWEYIDKKNI